MEILQDENAMPQAQRSAAAKAQVSKQYQKKTHLEHIKERPDTYIGSCESRQEVSANKHK
jgi:DNA gyrase/topoisomerase IV subunit B